MPGQRRDHDRARLRLPPRVDDRASVAADVLAIPHPRFRIDRLAHRSEQTQLREVVLLGVLRAPLHEGANRGRRRVEDRDAVLLAQLPEAILRRPVRRALVHQARRAVRERAVHDVRVSRHPAHVGGAPVDVVLLEIENRLRRERALREIAAGGMHDALRLSRRARGVQREENVFGIHRRRERRVADAFDIRSCHHWSRPAFIGAGDPPIALLRAPHDHHVLDRRRLCERIVRILLERHYAAATKAAVGRDEHLRLRVDDAIAQRLGREAAEHHRVHRADARAAEHRDRGLGNHRQVDRDAIALLHAERIEHGREAAHLIEQLRVRERAACRPAHPPTRAPAYCAARRARAGRRSSRRH